MFAVKEPPTTLSGGRFTAPFFGGICKTLHQQPGNTKNKTEALTSPGLRH